MWHPWEWRDEPQNGVSKESMSQEQQEIKTEWTWVLWAVIVVMLAIGYVVSKVKDRVLANWGIDKEAVLAGVTGQVTEEKRQWYRGDELLGYGNEGGKSGGVKKIPFDEARIINALGVRRLVVTDEIIFLDPEKNEVWGMIMRDYQGHIIAAFGFPDKTSSFSLVIDHKHGWGLVGMKDKNGRNSKALMITENGVTEIR